MTQIYCGNNLNYTGLTNGTHTLGTNYQCLRKGIGRGLHLPYDPSYNGVYAPVDNRRYYCGNSPVLPAGGNHFAIGSPSKCLSVGIGVGKSQRAVMGRNYFLYYIKYVLYFLFVGIMFTIMYLIKPKFITKKDLKNKDIIDWNKFIPYYLLFCLIIYIFAQWFLKKYNIFL